MGVPVETKKNNERVQAWRTEVEQPVPESGFFSIESRYKILNVVPIPEFMAPTPAVVKVREEPIVQLLDPLDTRLAWLQTLEVSEKQLMGPLTSEQQEQSAVFSGDESTVRRALFQRQQCDLLKQDQNDLKQSEKILESEQKKLEEEKLQLLTVLEKMPQVSKETVKLPEPGLAPPVGPIKLQKLADTLFKQKTLERVNTFWGTHKNTPAARLPYEALRQYEIDLRTLGLSEHAEAIGVLADKLTYRRLEADYSAKQDKIFQVQQNLKKVREQQEQVQWVVNLLDRMEQVTWAKAANQKLFILNKELNEIKPLKEILEQLDKLSLDKQIETIATAQGLQIPHDQTQRAQKLKKLRLLTDRLKNQTEAIDMLANHHLGLIRQFELEERQLPPDPFAKQMAKILYRDLGSHIVKGVTESDIIKAISETLSGFKESLPDPVTAVYQKLSGYFSSVPIDRVRDAFKGLIVSPGRELLADLVRERIMSKEGLTREQCDQSFKAAMGNVIDFFSGKPSKTSFQDIVVGLMSWLYNNPQAAQDLSADIQAVFEALNALNFDTPVDKLFASVKGRAQAQSLAFSGAYAEDTKLSAVALGFLEYARVAPYLVAATATPGSTLLGSLFSLQPHGILPSASISLIARVADFVQNSMTIAAGKVISRNVSNEKLPLFNAIQLLRQGADFQTVVLGLITNQKFTGFRRILDSYREHGFWKTAKNMLTLKDARRVWKYAGTGEKFARFAATTVSAVGAVMVVAGGAMAATVLLAPLGAVFAGVGLTATAVGYGANALCDGIFSASRSRADREEASERNKKNILKLDNYKNYLKRFSSFVIPGLTRDP